MTQPCEQIETIAELKSRWKIAGVIIPIIISSILAIVIFAGGILYRSSAKAKDAEAKAVEKVDAKTVENREDIQDLKVSVGKIETDVGNIKENVKEIKDTNKAILEAIKEIKD